MTSDVVKALRKTEAERSEAWARIRALGARVKELERVRDYWILDAAEWKSNAEKAEADLAALTKYIEAFGTKTDQRNLAIILKRAAERESGEASEREPGAETRALPDSAAANPAARDPDDERECGT